MEQDPFKLLNFATRADVHDLLELSEPDAVTWVKKAYSGVASAGNMVGGNPHLRLLKEARAELLNPASRRRAAQQFGYIPEGSPSPGGRSPQPPPQPFRPPPPVPPPAPQPRVPFLVRARSGAVGALPAAAVYFVFTGVLPVPEFLSLSIVVFGILFYLTRSRDSVAWKVFVSLCFGLFAPYPFVLSAQGFQRLVAVFDLSLPDQGTLVLAVFMPLGTLPAFFGFGYPVPFPFRREVAVRTLRLLFFGGLFLGVAGLIAGFDATQRAAIPPSDPVVAPVDVERDLGLDRAERRRIQVGLAGLGHYSGAIDGIFGQGTRRALRAWQADRAVAVTGFLDREAADALLALAPPSALPAPEPPPGPAPSAGETPSDVDPGADGAAGDALSSARPGSVWVSPSGVWVGAYLEDRPSAVAEPFRVVFGDTITTRYVDSRCTGELTPVVSPDGGPTRVFVESLTSGQSRCVDGGTVTLRFLDDSTIRFEWEPPSTPPGIASGIGLVSFFGSLEP